MDRNRHNKQSDSRRNPESMQSRDSSNAPRITVPVAADRPTHKIVDYINQIQENLNALKLELEEGTNGTYVDKDGKARLETCVMSCVATFVFGKADRHVPKKYELKLTCGEQQSSANSPVEMRYIETDVSNRPERILQLGTYLDGTLADVLNGAKVVVDNDNAFERPVGNRGKNKVMD